MTTIDLETLSSAAEAYNPRAGDTVRVVHAASGSVMATGVLQPLGEADSAAWLTVREVEGCVSEWPAAAYWLLPG